MNSKLDELFKTNPEKFPKGVAVALDGNRRWSKLHAVSETAGHRVSVEHVKDIIKRSAQLGVKTITFWIFSTENFKRNEEFLNAIFSLAREYLQSGKYFNEINEMGGKLGFIGDLSLFPKDISEKVYEYIKKSNPKNSVINVNYAFGYGGKDEIARAVKKMVKAGIKEEEVTEEKIMENLDLKEEVDLMVRTGGHKRLSGLLPFQTTYAEIVFTDTLCPDFTVSEFENAVEYYTTCTRNFGK